MDTRIPVHCQANNLFGRGFKISDRFQEPCHAAGFRILMNKSVELKEVRGPTKKRSLPADSSLGISPDVEKAFDRLFITRLSSGNPVFKGPGAGKTRSRKEAQGSFKFLADKFDDTEYG